MPRLNFLTLVLAIGISELSLAQAPIPTSPSSNLPNRMASSSLRSWPSICKDPAPSQITADFESLTVETSGTGQTARIAGNLAKPQCPQVNTLRQRTDPRLGSIEIEYQGGDNSERAATIIPDPQNPKNHVLQYWLQSPNVRNAKGQPGKGRVQMDVYQNRLLREVQYSVRLFLTDDFATVRNYPEAIHWLTIAEFWNNADWTREPFPFRITVDLVKPEARSGAPLHFHVRAQAHDPVTNSWSKQMIWSKTNTAVEVPTQKWMKLDYYWREGDRSRGRFYLAVTPEGGERKIIFDERNVTHHPDDINPNGLTHFNPLKLYTSREVVNYVKSQGHALNMYWDDVEIKFCWQNPDASSRSCSAPP